MKIKYILLSLLFIFFLSGPTLAAPYNNLSIDLFVGEGCPYCAKTEAYLVEQQRNNYPNMDINIHEIYHDADNQDLYFKYSEAYGFTPDGIPVTVIGNSFIEGANFDAIDKELKFCETNTCPTPSKIVNNYSQSRGDTNNSSNTSLDTSKYENAGWVIILTLFIVIAAIIIIIFKNKNSHPQK